MAALTMTPTTMRQPFASLDAPRMRSLLKTKMNIKNQQNGPSPAKRKPLAEVDAENIDPATVNMSTKRKRGCDEEDHDSSKCSPKPLKASRVALTVVKSNITSPMPSSTFKAPLSKPKSTPALKPVGRSPQGKSCKAFARRSTISKSRPELIGRKSISRPFSIATVLGNVQPKTQAAPKTPASWSFEIYVDSEQEEMTNLMQHSTCVLDISDDEGKAELSSRGKENIPPSELGIDLSRTRERETSVSRKTEMTDEPRSPLGELNAADYYGEDCHAFSYAVVYDEDETASETKTTLPPLPRNPTHPTRTKLSSVSTISSILAATQPAKTTESTKSEAQIEIWESQSTADESEKATESYPSDELSSSTA
ncbi:hypothetical protein IFM58399_01127 [Aspergillus lentulus]|uniref:Uncharacterized protein n=1 Tax=Aspergillus lentulus TaxID=293939 RepID=A0ABQ0ZRG8_ASPLE|nr:uncharacterized protein IFM58399_01127 [Aspergillus lentulus]KAF4157330.1 hypothetical protein CNMCM6069_005692 [Aspergillus lentulus]KAF4165932.1 hypothetical protein CNMCM6936_007235 [Aspergillus lentulus]GFF25689.1 hypothetical protein IFM58399_01127 [Aspergillus lentulus]GFF44721.1 hypothetical protein IFM62136_00064 [Aspergillus lentulus]GFF61838.1 hypothetical protein IFM60648_00417 [Aspergillus lentulus]